MGIRPLTRALVAGAALIAASGAAGCARPTAHRVTDSGPTTAPSQVRPVPQRYVALAHRVDPLSAAMKVNCGGAIRSVPSLAFPGGAERGNSPTSLALRHFLKHNPFEGMGSVTDTNWLLLSQTGSTLVFGQRHGRIGVGAVVVLKRKGRGYTASGEGGCGLPYPSPREASEPVAVTGRGSSLRLAWTVGNNCGSGPSKTDRVLSRVLVKQSPDAVHVLLLDKPAPNAGPQTGTCAGVGLEAHTTITLDPPLGHRRLIDDARIPGEAVVPG